MKIDIEEYKGCFSFNLIPETVEDAVVLMRVKLNGIKDVRGIYAYCHKDLTMRGSIVIGKRKEEIYSL